MSSVIRTVQRGRRLWLLLAMLVVAACFIPLASNLTSARANAADDSTTLADTVRGGRAYEDGKIDWTKLIDTSKIPSTIDRSTTDIVWEISDYVSVGGETYTNNSRSTATKAGTVTLPAGSDTLTYKMDSSCTSILDCDIMEGSVFYYVDFAIGTRASGSADITWSQEASESSPTEVPVEVFTPYEYTMDSVLTIGDEDKVADNLGTLKWATYDACTADGSIPQYLVTDGKVTSTPVTPNTSRCSAALEDNIITEKPQVDLHSWFINGSDPAKDTSGENNTGETLGVDSMYHPTEVSNFAVGITLTYPNNAANTSLQTFSYSQGRGHEDSVLKYVPSEPKDLGSSAALNDDVFSQYAAFSTARGRYGLNEAQKSNVIYGEVTKPETVADLPHNPDYAYTLYVEQVTEPCDLGGSRIPADTTDDPDNGCVALVDGLIANGAAYEDAVIGGGDDAKGTDGYSSLINESGGNILAQKNPTADITYTFKDSDGNKLGTFVIPAGATKKSQGSWTWEDGAKEYLTGAGAHNLTVELTSSTHTKDESGNPVVLKTWNTTVNVYVPAMDVADSDIIKGHYAQLSANMLPGSVLSESLGASGSLTEDNQVYWTKDHATKAEADLDIKAEKNLLTSEPAATPVARFLEGDQSVGLEMTSASSVKPATTTTFQVKFKLSGSTYSQAAETAASGLTDEVTNSTELYLWNQHNAYVGGNNSSMLGAPLDSAANSLKPDPAKGAFTIYVAPPACYAGGSTMPSADGCLGLNDGAIQNGAAHEFAVIGGGDDGRGMKGYSGLIQSDFADVFLQDNTDSAVTWTVKDADGTTLGAFTVPAGSKSTDSGTWKWKQLVSTSTGEVYEQDYLRGIGAHKLTVELTVSGHDKDANGDPVVIKTWHPTVTVYVPAMDVADSDIIKGHSNPMSANMLPGSVLSELLGGTGSLSEPNEVYWTKDHVIKAEADNDLKAETNVLTSTPTATPIAVFLQGDSLSQSEYLTSSNPSPGRTTTYQVKFELGGSTYEPGVYTVKSGLTAASDMVTGVTESYLWSQHNEYVGANNSSMIGAPLDSAANALEPDASKAAFTVYVGYSPCDLSGSHMPSTDADTGCIGLIDAAVQNGAAHEYAVIGGGDDGKDGNGYSGLIYADTTDILLQANPDATIRYTVKDSDGAELGYFTIPAGSTSTDDGKWVWKDGAQEYLKGVGVHKLTVELTASTHDSDPNGDAVVLRTWTPTVTVYIPAVHLNDSDIKLGSENPLENNMLPGGILSENTGVTGSPSESNEVYWEKKAMGEKASGDNDLAAENNVLTSAPTLTPVATFLEGDSAVGTDKTSTDIVSPTTSTTFQVRFTMSGSTNGDVETTPTGLTGDFVEGTTEQALYSQVSEYQLNAPNGAFGEFLGVPLDSAENPVAPDPAKAAFTIYVSGKTVSSLPLTGGTGAGLAAVLTGLGTILFAGLLAGMAWWTRRSRNAAHSMRV